MSVESELKDIVLERYKSVRAFSESIGLPYSTLDSIFKRGVENSSVANIIKICKALDIDADALGEGRIEKRATPVIQSAAAHFDVDTLTDEGRKMYLDMVEMLAAKYSKSSK